ncbi:glycosyltransferase [Neomicrococcus lactis]|uniref:Glycosyltransferase involved in cell wall biosynthesis/spore maturation protein CgeB n=1 Tax=Neomicrococcus lactis TaxID=732241 RepID=A0A7W8Y9Q8_9MICC|nr:glycosyltransferase [Neomicrococcus lactis]MBB5597497.1 glycosyltransferase involved in cell wall biosynthesis/spore maturation protein CgeB [Neomicrococcus lactis]
MSQEIDDLSLVERATRYAVVQQHGIEDKGQEELQQVVTELHFELERLKQELSQTEDAQSLSASQLAQSQKQLADMQRKMQKQLERATKFKVAYENLKHSPDVRIGRAVVGPMRKIRALASSPAKPELEQQKTPTKFVVAHADTAKSKKTEPIESAVKQRIAEAKRRYVRSGDVSEPLSILEELTDHLTSADKRLLAQIRGTERVMEASLPVPPRQFTPGYIPKKGRILYCAHSTGHFNSNGYSTRTAGLTGALSKISDIVVAARPGYPWDSSTHHPATRNRRFIKNIDGVTHVFNPGPSLKSDPIDVFLHRSADIFVREAIAQRASLIQSASNHLTALPALIAARRLGLPFVYEVRGLWEVTEASTNIDWLDSERYLAAIQLETQVAKEADKVLAITSQLKDELVRRGVSSDRIELLPNASDPFDFVPFPASKALKKKHSISDEDIVVGYAGSVIAYEGLELLVHGFHQALSTAENLKLVVVGDGAGLSKVRDLVSDLGITGNVRFAGRMPASKVPDYVNLMDIVACPRLSNPVTEMVSPIKPLEAFAAGKPVLASNVAPLVDLIGPDQERGQLFEAGDESSLCNALLELAADSELRADKGRSARTWVEANRSWEVTASSLKLIHDELLGLERNDSIIGTIEKSQKSLSEVTIALISDEFTRRSIESECNIVFPEPNTWREELEKQSVDALLIESAWEGNGGAWHRKVGYYDDESFADLTELVDWCRTQKIPTIFWNKEDPVHFQRFKKTAALADHVFTTDENMIPNYFATSTGLTKTYSTLPFWAQPSLHNPLPPAGERTETIAYGGSYYGDRYPDRSRTLSSLLESVSSFGLTIYDRQANYADSPYHYPENLRAFVQGGLSYPEMVDAYKRHPVHINVNSVVDSPTMFSRRVMELAACGTPTISGAGLGVHNIMDGLIPTTSARATVTAIANLWMTNEKERLRDAWKLHRHAYSAHLSEHRLALMLRTAGLEIQTSEVPTYCLKLALLTEREADHILAQSLLPATVLVSSIDEADQSAVDRLRSNGIEIEDAQNGNSSELPILEADGYISDPLIAEDLVRTSKYWSGPIEAVAPTNYSQRFSLWEPLSANAEQAHETGRGIRAVLSGSNLTGNRLRLWRPNFGSQLVPDNKKSRIEVFKPQRIVIAGHDLKFASQLISHLEMQGHQVRLDEWTGHSSHDEQKSNELLQWGQVLFCEWSLGNLEWYAARRKPGQRLITRFHSQELFTPHMQRLDARSVDKFVFVGELVKQVAIRRFNIPEERTVVIPNTLGVAAESFSADASRRFTLGLVGIVPQQKHLDRALDLLSKLRTIDDRFMLRVKGKQPEDYPWMSNRSAEMEYYEAQRQRIAGEPLLKGAVLFDPHGNDMADWYKQIGVVLSVSDFESFHLTIADGAATAAYPASLAWPGAKHIYPNSWLSNDIHEMAQKILSVTGNEDDYLSAAHSAQRVASESFGNNVTVRALSSLLTDDQ